MQVNSATQALIDQINGTTKSNEKTNNFDGNDFMLVLLAQLKNQNPLEPLQDKDLMAQMAQLNSLQELKNLNNRMDEMSAASQAGTAASLIGKVVEGINTEGDVVEGRVEGSAVVNGAHVLLINNFHVPLKSIVEVRED